MSIVDYYDHECEICGKATDSAVRDGIQYEPSVEVVLGWTEFSEPHYLCPEHMRAPVIVIRPGHSQKVI